MTETIMTILNRKSVRDYSEKLIEKDKLDLLVKVGMAGPRAMNKQTRELMSQHKWFRDNLDKCIRAIEAEKGLDPMPMSIEHPFLSKRDPNIEHDRIPKDEAFFTPYESPDDFMSFGEPNNIYVLQALLNLQLVSVNAYMADANDRIGNLENRLKRLEEYFGRVSILQNEPNFQTHLTPRGQKD